MFEIIPGILEKEWEEIERKLEIAKPFAKSIHVDIVDGIFADNTSFLDPLPIKKYEGTFLLELHMMVDNPVQYIEPYARAGFQRFVGHVEKMPDVVEFVAKAQEYGAVGLAFDKPTNLEILDTISPNDLDMLLVMTIKAGRSGQQFEEELLSKVKALREKYSYMPIEVDGGINDTTIKKALEAGATRFVSTSHIFGSQNPEESYHQLQSLVISH